MPPDQDQQAPDDTNAPIVTQPDAPSPPQPAAGNTPVSQSAPRNRAHKKLVLIITAALFLLIGGSAAAYFGLVVPNQPENVLKQALRNSLQQKRGTFTGTLNYEDIRSDGGPAPRAWIINFKGQADTESRISQSELDITMDGVKLPMEIRQVNNALYFKFGDLGSLRGAAALSNTYALPMFDALAKRMSDQWIEVDETLLKKADMYCALSTPLSLTEQDVQLMFDAYEGAPFASIKNTAQEDLDGKRVIKYEIEVDDNKNAEYVKNLKDVSAIKKLRECKNEKGEIDTKELADDDITPVTIWVDKASKTVRKIAMKSTQQDADKAGIKGDIEVTLDLGAEVLVTKPEGAKPLMQILGEISPLLQHDQPGLQPAAPGGARGRYTPNGNYLEM